MNHIEGAQIQLRCVDVSVRQVPAFRSTRVADDHAGKHEGDLRILQQIPCLPLQLAGQIPVIVIEHAQELATRGAKADVARRGKTGRNFIADDACPRVGGGQYDRNIRAVVNHDQFEVGPYLRQHALDGPREERFSVLRRDDDRN